MKNTYIFIIIAVIILVVIFILIKKSKPATNVNVNKPVITPDSSSSSKSGGLFPLKRGSVCEEVRNVQIWLGINADSVFGPKTQSSLKEKTGLTEVSNTKYNEILKELATPIDISVDGQALSLSTEKKILIDYLVSNIQKDLHNFLGISVFSMIKTHDMSLYEQLNDITDFELKYLYSRYSDYTGQSLYKAILNSSFNSDDMVTIELVTDRMKTLNLV